VFFVYFKIVDKLISLVK